MLLHPLVSYVFNQREGGSRSLVSKANTLFLFLEIMGEGLETISVAVGVAGLAKTPAKCRVGGSEAKDP